MALQSQRNYMYMCFLVLQKYGILVHNMEVDCICGTCLMSDGRYETLSWNKLDLAFKQVKEDSYVITPVKETQCRDLYIAAIADTIALESCIEKRQSECLQSVEDARLPAWPKVRQRRNSRTNRTLQRKPR
jgi:hypothetical protein